MWHDTRLVAALMEANANAAVAVDGSGTITAVNAELARLLGYAPAELVGQPVETLLPTDLASAHREQRSDYQQDPRARAMGTGRDLVARHRDGTEVSVEIGLTPVATTEGPWVVATLTDITVRRRAERRIRSISRAYLTLAQVNQAIIRSPDESILFSETCRIAVEHGGYSGAWVGVPDADGRRLHMVASAGPLSGALASGQRDAATSRPAAAGPAERSGSAVFVVDLLSDPSGSGQDEWARASGARSAASLPLRRSGAGAAVLTLYHHAVGHFTSEAQEQFRQLADNLSFALDSFDAARQRDALMERLVTEQETERARIAADVHDESVQSLAAIDLRLGLLQTKLHKVDPTLESTVVRIHETVNEVSKSLRNLLFSLEPPERSAGFGGAVRDAATHLFEGTGITWHLDAADGIELDDVQFTQALRITKEAIINVRKHARATSVLITLTQSGTAVQGTVTDDGVGLDEDLERIVGHRGLETMKDRAALAGGWCSATPVGHGCGTRVEFWIPLVRSSLSAPAATPMP